MLIETHIECCLNINYVDVSCHTGSASNSQWKDETPKHENVHQETNEKKNQQEHNSSEMLYGIDYVSYIFMYPSFSCSSNAVQRPIYVQEFGWNSVKTTRLNVDEEKYIVREI